MGELRQLVGVAGGERQQAVDVHADDVFGVEASELGRDDHAGVSPLGAVALVAEAAHQLGPSSGDSGGVPTGFASGAGKAKARKGWNNEVERVVGVTAAGARVAEWPDYLQELDD